MSLCICLLINVDHRRCQTVDQSLLLTHHPGPDSINIPARNFEIPLPSEKKWAKLNIKIEDKKPVSFWNPLTII